jgi:hypothetical protein
MGGPSDQRRHRLARVALLDHLLRESVVQHAFDNWFTRYGLRQPLETLTLCLDRLALDAGLTSRTALFTESTVDAATQQAIHEAYQAFWVAVNGNGLELIRDGYHLAEQLVTALGLSEVCIAWLTGEMVSWFFDSLRAQMENRAVTRRYTEEPFHEVLTVRIDPRMTARQQSRDMQQQVANQLAMATKQSAVSGKKMPKRGGHIATYVEWLVENKLHRVPVLALARALLHRERDVPRSPNYDARQRVQYGINQAQTWLAAVASLPSSRSAQPRRRTTRKSSTSRRRRSSPPR